MSLGVFRSPRNVVFGVGQRFLVATTAKQLGGRALVCTDKRFASDPQFDEILKEMKKEGSDVAVYDGVLPEAPTDCVEACLELANGFKPSLFVGIGGGSCLDVTKATALLLAHGGTLSDYYGALRVPGPTAPVVAIPTTAGTGSEVTPAAVLTDTKRKSKAGIITPHVIPHTAICDPELTYSCPPGLTAIAGADALTHAIECFTAARRTATADLSATHVFLGKNMFSDHFARSAIVLLLGGLERAVKNGADTEARADVMLGALYAGHALASAGTAAAHALQYPIGDLTHTPHGEGVAAVMPYVMEYNQPRCVEEFDEIGEILGLPTSPHRSPAVAAKIADLFARIGIPKTIREMGYPEDKLQWGAEQAITFTRLIDNNPRLLDVRSLTMIMSAAFSGDRAALR
ncbi:alcohol dehydrogenase [Bradyrhizobium sp. LTSP885]|uniref:iron-containing alcohol dehydrogenase n=1 Tax=Bradyrhizobium sp. LTSP885 TaxID=1619232 RepID=UPI0005CAA56A|nr:iron-containing alcohol dehydrogenase [Bradyrhizobium sp. LTSP885]KJC50459.1 alcohol dehydrogenase [Bradyrhizobium sp. LTSP885]